MTTTQTQLFAPEHAPKIRRDVVTRELGAEKIAWAPRAEHPVYLDPVAAALTRLMDGEATNADLVNDVHEALEVPSEIATAQLHRTLALLSIGRLLEPATESTEYWAVRRRLLPAPDW